MATAVEGTDTTGIADDWEDVVADNDNYSVISLPLSEDDTATDSSQDQQVTTSSESPIKGPSQILSEQPTPKNTPPSETVEEPPAHIENAVERCGMDLKDVAYETEECLDLTPIPITSRASLKTIASKMGNLAVNDSLTRLSRDDHRFKTLRLQLARVAHMMLVYSNLYEKGMKPPSLPNGLMQLPGKICFEILKLQGAQANTTGPLSEKRLHATLDLKALGLMAIMEKDYKEYKSLYKTKRASDGKKHETDGKPQRGVVRMTVKIELTCLSTELRRLRDHIVHCLGQIHTCAHHGDFSMDHQLKVDALVSGFRGVKSALERVLSGPIDPQKHRLALDAAQNLRPDVRELADDLYRQHGRICRRRAQNRFDCHIKKSTIDELHRTAEALVSQMDRQASILAKATLQ
ncbi:hypothetical protein NPX13_g9879 [Xylaria arbuscula]|uniref:Uncharacterized protein n=1 Tax=Xylaria arbuscula TaxID=114810 RepID=A0A9W8N5V1_9PEZI|nr:hypothetical protein NPX13_g9879 [Xylaria arbuscula]